MQSSNLFRLQPQSLPAPWNQSGNCQLVYLHPLWCQWKVLGEFGGEQKNLVLFEKYQWFIGCKPVICCIFPSCYKVRNLHGIHVLIHWQIFSHVESLFLLMSYNQFLTKLITRWNIWLRSRYPRQMRWMVVAAWINRTEQVRMKIQWPKRCEDVSKI